MGRRQSRTAVSVRRQTAQSYAEPASLQSHCIGQFLTSLSQEMLLELEALAAFSLCAPGTVLFADGQMPQEVFLLLSGRAKLYMNSIDDKRLTVHIAKAGEFLGLPAAFTLAPHTATAEILETSNLASLRCTDFLNYLLTHPLAAHAAARELSNSCDRHSARLRTIGVTPSNRAKLARLLLEWSSQGEMADEGIRFHLALKHADIAECVGIRRESVTRILRDLQRWQVIGLLGSQLTILDFSALEQCADLK